MSKEHHCVTNSGEHFVLLQSESNLFYCPVCGCAEFEQPPYDENGNPSFQQSSCGFEFGYDDSNLAAADAIEGVTLNWDRWRLKVIENNKHTKEQFKRLETNLSNIGYHLGFDLIPVKKSDST